MNEPILKTWRAATILMSVALIGAVQNLRGPPKAGGALPSIIATMTFSKCIILWQQYIAKKLLGRA